MENTNPVQNTVPVPPPPPQNTVVPNMPQSNKSSSRKLVLIGIVIMIVIIGALSFFLLSGKKQPASQSVQHLSLSINGQLISEDQLQTVHSYYKTLGLSEEAALANTKDLYVQNAVLSAAYSKSGLGSSALNTSLAKVKQASQFSGAPAEVVKVVEQNTAMKNALSPTIGVKDATGKVLRLGTSGAAEVDKEKTQILITSKLNSYRTKLTTKSMDEITAAFENDADIKKASLSAAVLSFTKMTPSHPIMGGQQFVTAVFNTQPKHSSQVFFIPTESGLYYGVVYITDTTGGKYTSYQSWYADQVKNVKVEANF